MKLTKPIFIHLITFATSGKREIGEISFLFQAVIKSDINLDQEFLTAQNEEQIRAVNERYISKHKEEIKSFLPKGMEYQKAVRIIYYQQKIF